MKHENLKHIFGLLSLIILIICLVLVFNYNLEVMKYKMLYAITFFSGLLVVIECIDLYKIFTKKTVSNI